MSDEPIKDLNSLLIAPFFSRQNAEKIARICYDAARLVYERQKQTGKAELKPKEITGALAVAETLHSSAFRFIATGELSRLFGGECTEQTAWQYCWDHVLGEVKDIHGRTIIIDDDCVNSLYKEPATGRHVRTSENYEEVRGKRLPWIRHTLQNSPAIYAIEEPIGRNEIRRKFIYTATATIKLRDNKEQTSYYMVVVREQKKGQSKEPIRELRMVTAFSSTERTAILHAIAMGSLYVHQK
jgi:hypothetical protein